MSPAYITALALYEPSWLRTAEPDALPTSVCGLLASMLAKSPEYTALQHQLATTLRRRIQPAHASYLSLSELCLAADGLHALLDGNLPAHIMATLTQRLIAAETAVGGPYAETGQAPTDFTNACVAQCTQRLAGRLPQVETFLANNPALLAVLPRDRVLFLALQDSTPADQPAVRDLRQHHHLLAAALSHAILDRSIAARQHHDTQHQAASIRHYVLRRTAGARQAEPLRGLTQRMLRSVVAADTTAEIGQLARFYGLGLPAHAALTPDLYRRLGAANTFAWAAYTIYDDFLDDEGQPAMLATANLCARAMLHEYRQALPDHQAFHAFTEATLQIVDQANTQETTSLRFHVSRIAITITPLPDLGDGGLLADRALFHTLGPMASLAASDTAVDSQPWRDSLAGWRHYLLARQLNDDIHDWAKDLQAGHATFVVLALLRSLNISPGIYRLDELLPYARRHFWQHVLPDICDTALAHNTSGRTLLASHLPKGLSAPLNGLFARIENSMVAAKAQRQQGLKLVQAFTPGY